MRNVRRQQVEQKRKRRRLVFLTFGLLLFVYLSGNLVVGENGLLRYLELRSTKDKLLKQTISIEKQNEEIKDTIKNIENTPEHVEELARKYGLTKEGEWVFKFKDKE
jgi:cell division protein FtsB